MFEERLKWKDVKNFVKENDLEDCEIEVIGFGIEFVVPEDKRKKWTNYPPVASIETRYNRYTDQYQRSWIVRGTEVKKETISSRLRF